MRAQAGRSSGGPAASRSCSWRGAVRADAPLPPWVDDGRHRRCRRGRARSMPKPGERGAAGRHGALRRAEPRERPARRDGAAARRCRSSGRGAAPAARGAGCSSGPLAWTCSDDADPRCRPSRARPRAARRAPTACRASTSSSARRARARYASLDARRGRDARPRARGRLGRRRSSRSAVARGERWVRTSKGLWIAARELGAARPSAFHGEAPRAGALDFAWVLAERASVWPQPIAPRRKPQGRSRARFQVVHVAGRAAAPYVRVGEGRVDARPRTSPAPTSRRPPPRSTGRGERWIDVDLATPDARRLRGRAPGLRHARLDRARPGRDGQRRRRRACTASG